MLKYRNGLRNWDELGGEIFELRIECNIIWGNLSWSGLLDW
jgi:hypothetical protein